MMRLHRRALCLLLLTAAGLAACSSRQPKPPPPEPELLDTFKGQHRVYLVFAAAEEGALAEQDALIDAEKAAWRGADLLLLEIVEGAPIRLAGQKMMAPKGKALRETFEAPSGAFTGVLIGLDGEEKLRVQAPTPVQTLIDADSLEGE